MILCDGLTISRFREQIVTLAQELALTRKRLQELEDLMVQEDV
jgi:hypothetical protein